MHTFLIKNKSSQVIEILHQFEMHVILVKITDRGYSSNNVVVDKAIVLNSSCTVGDRSLNVGNRACILILEIGLRFFKRV